MPAQLTHPAPTPETRWAAIEQELHGLKLIDDYWRRPGARTAQHDAAAVLLIYQRAYDIYKHVEACAVTAARFPQETREILAKLAAAHRVRVASMPPPPTVRANASRDPRRRLPSPPEPHKDVSNDGGVARSHARRAPIVAKPYQRPARPTARKQRKVEDVEDVPPAIAASVRVAQADDRAQVQQVVEPVAGDVSLDDLCELFSATSLSPAAPAPSASPAPAASPATPKLARARPSVQPSTPMSTRTLTPPPAPFSSRICGKPAPVPARPNPLDRSSRRRLKTAEV